MPNVKNDEDMPESEAESADVAVDSDAESDAATTLAPDSPASAADSPASEDTSTATADISPDIPTDTSTTKVSRGPSAPDPTRKRVLTASGSVAILLIIGTIVYFNGQTTSAGNISGSQQTGAVQAANCPKTMTITSPVNGAKVANGANGETVGITTCGLPSGDTGWLFDYDTHAGTYTADGRGGAAVTADGKTTFSDNPIGDQGESNDLTKITLLLADAACVRALNVMESAAEPPNHLPSSCQVMSQVDVSVTYP